MDEKHQFVGKLGTTMTSDCNAQVPKSGRRIAPKWVRHQQRECLHSRTAARSEKKGIRPKIGLGCSSRGARYELQRIESEKLMRSAKYDGNPRATARGSGAAHC